MNSKIFWIAPIAVMALGFLPELKQSQPDGSMMMKQSISRCQRSNKKGILKC